MLVKKHESNHFSVDLNFIVAKMKEEYE